MKTITIQTDREEKYLFFLELAKKLHLPVLHTDENELADAETEEFEDDEKFSLLFEKELGISLSHYRKEIIEAEKEQGFNKETFFANFRQWRKEKGK